MGPTLRAFASIHQTQRLIFSKSLDLNNELALAKKFAVLTIFLSQLDLGFKKYFDDLASLDPNHPHFSRVISWAHDFLSSLMKFPYIFNICIPSGNDNNNVRFISCGRDWLYRGLIEGVYGTYRVLFDDIMEERGLSERKLNPNAREWSPRADVEEESRFLFITFSRGLPSTCYEIRCFFNWLLGPYIDSIYIHKRGGGYPLFGKIAFKFSYVPYLILSGREQVEFMINGKTIRCKKYNRRN